MAISDHIEKWIEEQTGLGRSRDEIAGTHFANGSSIAVIKKAGRKGYRLDIYVQDKAVFFPPKGLTEADVLDKLRERMEKLEGSGSRSAEHRLGELSDLAGWIECGDEY